MTEKKSIKDTLDTIRKALEEDLSSIDQFKEKNESEILILNKLVKEDGTIDILNDSIIKKYEVREILDDKISNAIDKKFDKWLDKNLPGYLEKYLKSKKF